MTDSTDTPKERLKAAKARVAVAAQAAREEQDADEAVQRLAEAHARLATAVKRRGSWFPGDPL